MSKKCDFEIFQLGEVSKGLSFFYGRLFNVRNKCLHGYKFNGQWAIGNRQWAMGNGQ
jgi:hypothetical protein